MEPLMTHQLADERRRGLERAARFRRFGLIDRRRARLDGSCEVPAA